MNKTNDTIDEKELTRLLAANLSPVATPAMLVKMTRLIIDAVARIIENRPEAGQVWGRISDIQRLYNVSDSAAKSWMAKLRAAGKVRMQRPISGAKGTGDLFYNLGDIARAYEENAKQTSQR